VIKIIEKFILTFELINYNEETHDFTAKFGDMIVKVDLFVGCVWNKNKNDLGFFTFEGFWHLNCFLPGKEITV
jgi:hypothetical protein